MMTSYGDEHRIFLQGIMTRGILSHQEVLKLFATATDRCKVVRPENRKELGTMLGIFIKCINDKLDKEKLNLKINKASEEDRRTKITSYVLVNRMDRSSDSTQLTKKAMVDFTPAELEYLKLIVERVVDSEERELEPIEALNLSRQVKTKMLKPSDGEEIVEKLVENKWLVRMEPNSVLRLSSRFLAEMQPFLKEVHGHEIGDCVLCKSTVFRAIVCSNCDSNFHLYCLSANVPANLNFAKCTSCKQRIDFPAEKAADAAAPQRPRGGEKRKKIDQTLNDSELD